MLRNEYIAVNNDCINDAVEMSKYPGDFAIVKVHNFFKYALFILRLSGNEKRVLQRYTKTDLLAQATAAAENQSI